MSLVYADPPQLRFTVHATRAMPDVDLAPVHYTGEQLAPDADRAITGFTDRIKLDMLDDIVIHGQHRPYPLSSHDQFTAQAWLESA